MPEPQVLPELLVPQARRVTPVTPERLVPPERSARWVQPAPRVMTVPRVTLVQRAQLVLPGRSRRTQRRVQHPGFGDGFVSLERRRRPDGCHVVDNHPVLGSCALRDGLRLLRT